jgi:hypothetical protein
MNDGFGLGPWVFGLWFLALEQKEGSKDRRPKIKDPIVWSNI